MAIAISLSTNTGVFSGTSVSLEDAASVQMPIQAGNIMPLTADNHFVPPLNIAALLIGKEPRAAAGPSQSLGRNFADVVGNIGDPFDLGDLLPPTQLAFSQPEVREIAPDLNDREPDGLIQGSGPAGRDVIDNVSEPSLPGTRANGNVETPGSTAGNGSDSTTGTILVTSPDGTASITINGFTGKGIAGQQIKTSRGVLTFGALNGDQVGYTYCLTDNM